MKEKLIRDIVTVIKPLGNSDYLRLLRVILTNVNKQYGGILIGEKMANFERLLNSHSKTSKTLPR